MSKELRELRHMVARKMSSSKMGHRFHVPSKGAAYEMFKAKVNKKKLPDFSYPHSKKNPEYAKMSIDAYESKYS